MLFYHCAHIHTYMPVAFLLLVCRTLQETWKKVKEFLEAEAQAHRYAGDHSSIDNAFNDMCIICLHTYICSHAWVI